MFSFEQRRMNQTYMMVKVILFRAIFCVGLATIVLGILSAFYFVQNPERIKVHFQNWMIEEEAVTSTVSLPSNNGELTLTVVPLHPFLSEYKYIVRVRMKNGAKFKQVLEIQPGGPPDVMALYLESPEHQQLLCFRHSCGGNELFEVLDLRDGKLHRYSSFNEVKMQYQMPKQAHIVNLGFITEGHLSLSN